MVCLEKKLPRIREFPWNHTKNGNRFPKVNLQSKVFQISKKEKKKIKKTQKNAKNLGLNFILVTWDSVMSWLIISRTIAGTFFVSTLYLGTSSYNEGVRSTHPYKFTTLVCIEIHTTHGSSKMQSCWHCDEINKLWYLEIDFT